MKSIKLIFVFAFISLFFFSCDSLRIEKRRYMKGYYVSSSLKKASAVETKTISAPIAFIKQHQLDSLSGLSLKSINSAVSISKTGKITPFSFQKNKPLILENKYYKGNNRGARQDKNSLFCLKKGQKDTSYRNGNYMLAGMVAFCSLVFVGFLKIKKNTAIRLSKWAAKRKLRTQLLIAGLHLMLGIVGHCIGSYLGDFNVFISDFTRNFIVFGFLAGMLLYPKKMFGFRVHDAKQYIKRKIADFALVLMGFLLTVCHGNDLAKPNRIEQSAEKAYSQSYDASYLTDQMKSQKSIVLSPAINETGAMALKTFLTVLTVLLVVVLQIVIVVFACALSCSQQEGAAAILLIGGTLLLAFLAVFAFIGISHIKSSDADSSDPLPH